MASDPLCATGTPCVVVTQAVATDVHLREQLSQSLTDHMESINSALDPHEQLDFLVVVRDQWTVENGLITPTLKIKRAELEASYGPRFEAWASARQVVVWA